ncbi:MAG TPA: HD domain-containing protein [Nanoarchaeota archaeon]|nr:HD domain-containing protein [Nanoarchaeota archaeon]
MDIRDSEQRHEMLESLIAVTDFLTPAFSERLKSRLNDKEKLLYEAVEGVTFAEGNWYRPHHNFIVTASMLSLCFWEGLDRNVLMPAAILHDIGYSALKISKYGADWNSRDKRIAHMEAGAVMAADILKGTASMPAEVDGVERVEEIVEIIRTHDNCYIGEPYETDNQLYHRDADRLYVMSFSSFYKDFLNYLDTGKITSVEDYLLGRGLSFYNESKEEVVEESGNYKYIPFTLMTAKRLGDEQFRQRTEEINQGVIDMHPEHFAKYSKDRLLLEADWILSELS